MGTIAILIGAILFTCKSAFKPKVRKLALISYLACNGFWIPMAILVGTWFMLVAQIVLFGINTRGLINIRREIKNE